MSDWFIVNFDIESRFRELIDLHFEELGEDEQCPLISLSAQESCIELAKALMPVFGNICPAIFPRDGGGICMFYSLNNCFISIDIHGSSKIYSRVAFYDEDKLFAKVIKDVNGEPKNILEIFKEYKINE